MKGYVYLLRSRATGLYKIGMSGAPDERVKQIEAEIRGMGWELVAELPSTDMRALERAFHAAFAEKRAGRKEWFALSPEDVGLFVTLADTASAPKLQQGLIGIRPFALPHVHVASLQALLRRIETRTDVFRDLLASDPGSKPIGFPYDFAREIKEFLGPHSVIQGEVVRELGEKT